MTNHEKRELNPSVADDNVQRLIAQSYRPETPDADFIARVQQRLLKTAREQHASPAPELALRPWQVFAGWGAAIALLIAVIIFGNIRPPQQDPPFYRDGDVAWIDGQAYVAQGAPATALPDDDLRPLDATLASFERNRVKYDVSKALVAGPRAEGASPQAAQVGDEIVTKPGERRRLTLADDSVLYVNESTQLKIVAPYHVELNRGEVFVEVVPRDEAFFQEHDIEGPDGATFVVTTPGRKVTALGTKFAVRAGEEDSRVLVAQGKVQLSDVEQPISAGQQFTFHEGQPVIDAAPRADHALDWMRELVAAAEGALIPANEKAGGALIAVDPHGQDAQLSLRKYHVDIHIEDGFARTTIDQTYFNHMWSRLEGTFYFPLPPDASLSRLAMYVNGKLMEGGMAERDYARQVFETIKHRQLDPALLEWVDGSTFKMRVFPLEPRQEKRIILSYTQKLDVSYGRTAYRFPAGHNMKVVGQWSTSVRVKHGAKLVWNSPSHELKAKQNDGDLVLTAESKLDRLNRDLVVFLSDDSIAAVSGTGVSPVTGPNRRDAGSTSLTTTTHENAHYLLLRYRPVLPTQPVRQRRNWIFLFESSADRNPLLARTQIEIVRSILNHAEHDDTFAIVTAGPYTHAFDAQPQAATAENIGRAMEYLDQTHLVGALDLGNAFGALKPFVEAATNPVIVHVGSGIPVLGEREHNKLVQMLPADAEYVGVGVGKRFNRSLMKLAAARTGGYFTQINPDESLSWRGFELVSALNTPRLLDVKIETDSGACQMLALQDSLAHGEELCAVGRYENAKEAPTEITITAQLDGQPFTKKVPVKVATTPTRSASEEKRGGASPLPRIWAKQQIELLTSLGAEQHKDRIVALSKAMYVMSPFTSLLVLENEEMYEQYKIDRGRKDHWAIYPAPEVIEVVEERGENRDEGGEKSEERGERGEERLAEDGTSSKPSVAEVLDSILVHRPAPVLRLPDGGHSFAYTTTVLKALGYAYAWPFNTVETTVTVPDGGTVLRGGVERYSYGDVPLTALLALDFNGRRNANAHGPLNATWWYDNDIDGIPVTEWTPWPVVDGVNGTLVMSESLAFHDRRVRDTTWDALNRGDIFGGRFDWQTPTNRPVAANRLHQIGLSIHNFSDNDLDQLRLPAGSFWLENYKSGLGQGAASADFDWLIDLITATVRPTTWEQVGGPGAIEPFPGNLSLVISQTHDVTTADVPVQFWNSTTFSPDGRLLVTGTPDHRIRLWDASSTQRGQPVWTTEYIRGVGFGARQFPIASQMRADLYGGTHSEFDIDFTGGSFTTRVPQFGGFDERLPPQYRSVIDEYYRHLSGDEDRTSLTRNVYLDIVGEIPTVDQARGYLNNFHLGQTARPFLDFTDPRFTAAVETSRMTGYVRDILAVREARERGVVDSLFQVEGDFPLVDRPPLNSFPRRHQVPPWEIEPTAPMLDKLETLVDVIRDPEITLTVTLGKLRPLQLKQPVIESSIDNPSIAALVRKSATELELVGRRIGVTTLTLQYEGIGDEPEVIQYLVNVRAEDDDESDLAEQQLLKLIQELRSRRQQLRTALVEYVHARVNGQISHPNTLYQRPQFSGSGDVFRKLVSYAPAMNTSWADVQAVVAAEADVAPPLRGKVDAGAKRLIDRARATGWQSIEWKDDDGKTTFSLAANGQGQYRYERRTRFGLAETTICDGNTLRHHYAELGLGANRDLSRFHRRGITELVPWAVLPADDLAVGADVRLVNENTIAIVPFYAEAFANYVEVQMAFAPGGRLAERRAVLQPEGKTLLRVTYSPDGAVRWLDGAGDGIAQKRLAVKTTIAPNLKPDESQLVVLPLPARTRAHALRTAEADFSDGVKFSDFSEEAALRMLAANMYYEVSTGEAIRVAGQRFFKRGDRRLGFYTIMLSAGNYWNTAEPVDLGRGRTLLCDPRKDHPNSPLATYIASQMRYEDVGDREDPPTVEGPQDGFIQQLAEYRRQYVLWSTGRWQEHQDGGDPFSDALAKIGEISPFGGDPVKRTIDFVQRLHAPEFRWVLLGHLQGHVGNDPQRKVASAYERLEHDPVLGYLARYEHARALYGVGEKETARKIFADWHKDTLDAGALPRIDNDFRRAFGYLAGDPFGDGSSDAWIKLMRDTAQKFVDEGRRPTALTLAWQCHQLGDGSLANQLFAIAMTGVERRDRFAMTLAGVEFLTATGQQKRALALLEPLLADEETSQLSALWRLGATLAQQQSMTARSAKMLEQALALEYGALEPDDMVNLEQLRTDYGELLSRYEQLATALASLEEEPSPELLSRLIGAADRWRSMEDDVSRPCHEVARIFSMLGAEGLAWQYVTTPLAARPNEASPWLDLADAMRSQQNYAMADRAYREAFRAEGTNAQILWDHAQMMTELGRYEQSGKLYQQIAAGDWQPRFAHLKQQAEQIVGK